jgi:hypothetical protein
MHRCAAAEVVTAFAHRPVQPVAICPSNRSSSASMSSAMPVNGAPAAGGGVLAVRPDVGIAGRGGPAGDAGSAGRRLWWLSFQPRHRCSTARARLPLRVSSGHEVREGRGDAEGGPVVGLPPEPAGDAGLQAFVVRFASMGNDDLRCCPGPASHGQQPAGHQDRAQPAGTPSRPARRGPDQLTAAQHESDATLARGDQPWAQNPSSRSGGGRSSGELQAPGLRSTLEIGDVDLSSGALGQLPQQGQRVVRGDQHQGAA